MQQGTDNKTLRIRTNVGTENSDKFVTFSLDQDISNIELLSLNINIKDLYRLDTSSYGCVAGRVLANDGVGIPNVKISLFVGSDGEDDEVMQALYPFVSAFEKTEEGTRYNLFPDTKVSVCHNPIGTFPNKRMVLDDDVTQKIYEKYYKYTTRTNDSGDYMLFGIPVGSQVIHSDIDLSDIGILSQKPRDMIYKGYSITQFENANVFKSDKNTDSLAQVITQNDSVYVYPFWGDDSSGEIRITRNDINIQYKFEPTCVFIGSVITDNKTNGVSVDCVATEKMGQLNQMTTGRGTIEMIRKTQQGTVESFDVQGTQLIDGSGTWCYQIPMNLDRFVTDEYGNFIPTNDPNKGIATRARVRFRVSLTNFDDDSENSQLVKVLVPNNPKEYSDLDYHFGSKTVDDDFGTKSFRDLFWNNVYTVKSYIPRVQRGNKDDESKFTGIKMVNDSGSNNPLPYNNMRVNMSLAYNIRCATLKGLIRVVSFYNRFVNGMLGTPCTTVGDGMCPDLENWYFAPGCNSDALDSTLNEIRKNNGANSDSLDPESIDVKNKGQEESICVTSKIHNLFKCIEISLAMKEGALSFDFYNDWINGVLYIPRWFANIRKKKQNTIGTSEGTITNAAVINSCSEDKYFNRRYVQQCALEYAKDANGYYTEVATPYGCEDNETQKCHKGQGRRSITVFNGKGGGGFLHIENTIYNQNVYYFKPCEWIKDGVSYGKRCPMFATDIVLLGSLDENNQYGIPSAFESLSSTTYKLPPNIVQTNLGTQQFMLGYESSGMKCSGNRVFNDDEHLVRFPQDYEEGFISYSKWIKKTDFFEANPEEDPSEWPISEISGIDWGYNGPQQGENNLGRLYFPGGHFLGISCTNSETNIKSCVNLSRICEIGVTMSQLREIPYVSDHDVKYAKLIPNGLVNKYDITDSKYRKIFATLNYNNLKTRVNRENGYLEYDIKPLSPNGFNGDLSNIVYSGNTEYNHKVEKEGHSGYTDNTYVSSIENKSVDYYRFRMGLHDYEGGTNNQDEKFLINYGGNVSMPVYENSYYFYFGIDNGNTALDRFLTNFHASCEINEDNDRSFFNVSVTAATQCSNFDNKIENIGDGVAYVEIDRSVSPPYTLTLMNGNDRVLFGDIEEMEEGLIEIKRETESHGGKKKITFYNNRFVINGLSEGKYLLTIENEVLGVLSTRFNIDVQLDELNSGVTLNVYDFIDGYDSQSISVNLKRDVVENEDGSRSFAEGGYFKICGINPASENSFEGILILTDDRMCYMSRNNDYSIMYDGSIAELIGDSYSQTYGKHGHHFQSYKTYEELSWEEDGMECVVIPAWLGNDTYHVSLIFRCNKDGSEWFSKFDLRTVRVLMNLGIDVYIGDEDFSYYKVIKPIIENEDISSRYGGYWVNYVLNNVDTDYYTDVARWKFLQSVLYRETMYTGEQKNRLPIKVINAKGPYTQRLGVWGQKIEYDSDTGVGQIDFIEDPQNGINNSFLIPTARIYTKPYYFGQELYNPSNVNGISVYPFGTFDYTQMLCRLPVQGDMAYDPLNEHNILDGYITELNGVYYFTRRGSTYDRHKRLVYDGRVIMISGDLIAYDNEIPGIFMPFLYSDTEYYSYIKMPQTKWIESICSASKEYKAREDISGKEVSFDINSIYRPFFLNTCMFIDGNKANFVGNIVNGLPFPDGNGKSVLGEVSLEIMGEKIDGLKVDYSGLIPYETTGYTVYNDISKQKETAIPTLFENMHFQNGQVHTPNYFETIKKTDIEISTSTAQTYSYKLKVVDGHPVDYDGNVNLMQSVNDVRVTMPYFDTDKNRRLEEEGMPYKLWDFNNDTPVDNIRWYTLWYSEDWFYGEYDGGQSGIPYGFNIGNSYPARENQAAYTIQTLSNYCKFIHALSPVDTIEIKNLFSNTAQTFTGGLFDDYTHLSRDFGGDGWCGMFGNGYTDSAAEYVYFSYSDDSGNTYPFYSGVKPYYLLDVTDIINSCTEMYQFIGALTYYGGVIAMYDNWSDKPSKNAIQQLMPRNGGGIDSGRLWPYKLRILDTGLVYKSDILYNDSMDYSRRIDNSMPSYLDSSNFTFYYNDDITDCADLNHSGYENGHSVGLGGQIWWSDFHKGYLRAFINPGKVLDRNHIFDTIYPDTNIHSIVKLYVSDPWGYAYKLGKDNNYPLYNQTYFKKYESPEQEDGVNYGIRINF